MKTVHVEPAFRGIVDKVMSFMQSDDPIAARAMGNEELEVGRSSVDPSFMIPGHALDFPVFVGDAAHITPKPNATKDALALFEKDPSQVLRFPRWNRMAQKWDIFFREAKAGRVSDAAPDLIAAQLLAAPGLVGWFEQLFRRPLMYFRARDLVKVFQGTSPWAPVLAMVLANYSGGASFGGGAGGPENNASADVNAQVNMMTGAVIDISVSYSLSVEELERAKGNTMPFGSQMIDTKRSYWDYAMELITNALIYFGNAESDTPGLLDVDTIEDYTGQSAEHISLDGTNTAKGSAIYQALASRIGAFLTRSGNKFNKVKVAVSPGYWNLLGWVPYSDVYNPDAPRVQILKNFIAGGMDAGNTDARKIDIEIISDPLLGPSGLDGSNVVNPFNLHEYDYTVITAPEIKAGPEEASQPVVLCGIPLDSFVYPTIPGQYMTNYKKLRRYGGVYAPVKAGVHVIRGLGFQPSDT